jgi:5-methylcytosine-specific restriction endonuclease McrA
MVWRKANPAKRREQKAKFLRENSEKESARHAEYRRTHKEKEAIRTRAWSIANRERKAALDRAWTTKDPVRNVVRRERYEARKAAAPGLGVTTALWREILAASLGLCAYCNQRKPLAIEHIDSLARGGAHEPANIVAACKSCNSSKGVSLLLPWLARARLLSAAA